MTHEKTAYEAEVARINLTEGPRGEERIAALPGAHGLSYFELDLDEGDLRDEVRRIWQEEAKRTSALIAAIPDQLRIEHEVTERNRRLDRLLQGLVDKGERPEDVLDDAQIFLRGGFLGIDLDTRSKLITRLEERKREG